MHGVGNVNLFIKEFKLRLIDRFKQDWHPALGSHDFYTYTLISTNRSYSDSTFVLLTT